MCCQSVYRQVQYLLTESAKHRKLMSLELQISELQKDNGQLKQRVAKLERTVAFLLDQLKLTYIDKPEEQPFPDVAALVNQGNKLEAIKLYREKTGASLADAQRFVNGL